MVLQTRNQVYSLNVLTLLSSPIEQETSPENSRSWFWITAAARWKHHSCGIFTNPIKRTSFEFKEEDGTFAADILSIDSRFVSLLKWLGENHINVRLSGENQENGYAVYKIRETAFGGGTKLSAEDGFLQFMIERLLCKQCTGRDRQRTKMTKKQEMR